MVSATFCGPSTRQNQQPSSGLNTHSRPQSIPHKVVSEPFRTANQHGTGATGQQQLRRKSGPSQDRMALGNRTRMGVADMGMTVQPPHVVPLQSRSAPHVASLRGPLLHPPPHPRSSLLTLTPTQTPAPHVPTSHPHPHPNSTPTPHPPPHYLYSHTIPPPPPPPNHSVTSPVPHLPPQHLHTSTHHPPPPQHLHTSTHHPPPPHHQSHIPTNHQW